MILNNINGLSVMNRIINCLVYYFAIVRAKLLYTWRFKRCGTGITFGHINRIIGYAHIEIGSNTSFGNNLRIEAIDRYGGAILPINTNW